MEDGTRMLLSLSNQHPIILIDGECVLCNGFIRFLSRKDTKGLFHYGTLQSSYAKKLQEEYQINLSGIETVIAVDQERVFTHSEVLKLVAQKLRGFWLIVLPFYVLPNGIRTAIYNWAAKNRYRWFGNTDVCVLYDEGLQKRVIDNLLYENN